MNYSFWADEAFVSGLAKLVIEGKVNILQAFSTLSYQKLYILLLSVFFKLFGISEFSARLPSIIAYILGIAIIFTFTKKLSNAYGGLISTFLYMLSSLILSYATQTKPNIILGTIALLILFLLIDLEKFTKKQCLITKNLVLIILLIISTLLHSIGIFMWIPYIGYIFLSIKASVKHPSSQLLGLIIFLLIFIIVIILSIVPKYFFVTLLPYNHSLLLLKIFCYKYSVITVSAVFGFIWLFRKYYKFMISVLFYILTLIFFWNFYAFPNIRYILPIFEILFVLFGVFWAKVGEKYDNNLKFKIFNLKLSGKIIIPLVVMLLLYVSGYKIVRWPQAYYNPNIDKYGDVQIANYKDFYAQLKNRFPNYKKVFIMNDTFDAEYWYLGRYSNAYFMKFTPKPYQHAVVKDVMVYGSLDDFMKIIRDQPQGLLIMEDWESFLPEDIKQYAKKNLHLEFRVESLKEALDDPWPLALYSWGFEK